MTKTIDPTTARSLYETYQVGDVPVSVNGWSRLDRHLFRTARWQEVYWLVVSDPDGVTWGLEYREGLTENQEGSYPWEDATDPLPLVRLYPHRVTRVEYRAEET